MGMSHKFRLRIMCDRCFKTFGINADKLFEDLNYNSRDYQKWVNFLKAYVRNKFNWHISTEKSYCEPCKQVWLEEFIAKNSERVAHVFEEDGLTMVDDSEDEDYTISLNSSDPRDRRRGLRGNLYSIRQCDGNTENEDSAISRFSEDEVSTSPVEASYDKIA